MFKLFKKNPQPETTPKEDKAKEKGKMLEVIFSKMNSYGVVRYSDSEYSVMLDPTGELKKGIQADELYKVNHAKNPYGESRF